MDISKEIIKEKAFPQLEEFVMEFQRDRCQELSELNRCLHQSDFEGIRQMAHRWKGFSEPYGFKLLAVLGQQLEKMAEERDLEGTVKIISEIEKYLLEKGRILGSQ